MILARSIYFRPTGRRGLLALVSSTRRQCCPLSSSSNENSLVQWEVDADRRVGTMTLNSPKTFNALTVEMGEAFRDRIQKIRHDLTDGKQNVNAIVLMGAGEQAFSAGGDIAWLKSLGQNSTPENEEIMLSFYKSFLCVRKLPVPVIAAVQGPAVGAGFCLALACDLRVVAPKPRIFGFTFSSLGIHCGMGGSHLMQNVLGSTAIYNEFLLTGKVVGGEEAYRLGLANRVAEDPKKEAQLLADEVARQNPMAIRTMTQTLRYQQDKGLSEALLLEAKAQAICYSRNDWGEGVDAAIQKREPVFDDFHTSSS